MPIDSESPVQISEIIDTVTGQADGRGYLGFIITYSNGRIDNKVLEYDRESYKKVYSRIERLQNACLKRYKSSVI